MCSPGIWKDESDAAAVLGDRVRWARAVGRAHLRLFVLDETTRDVAWPELADRIVVASCFPPPRIVWHEMLPHDARGHLHRIVSRDLTSGRPVVDEPLVRPLVEGFLALFGPRAIFFCNTARPWDQPGAGSWTPLTTSRRDTGVVAIDGKRGGLLWVEE